ncbi:hypothetical protein EU803_03250 [Loktanella sp. IMCC34160]|uniref:DUF6389 family protein n=1 Tax=Loktanella sp. IMCC34160 TaxID=2510646 RepID=UPI00101CFE5A|nr:DUF6389 family protein [Loktanella sp. IMCC34160]RYG93135.1 hypothetical protein EU803_03250 [Loktanella sp. IMCC34160]
MNAASYSESLLHILRQHTADAVAQVQKIKSSMPPKAMGIAIGVHPNQEPDGMFDILVHLEGPDLHCLNKAIDGYRYLFSVSFEDGKLAPNVPLFDPFNTDFEVNDVIVDTSIVWLKEVWSMLEDVDIAVPVTAFGADGYGTRACVKIR